MPIDLAILASTVVAKYLFPYAAQAATSVAQLVTEKVGQPAAELFNATAKKVWDRITTAFAAPKEKSALELFKDDPEGLKATVEKMLHQKLQADPELAKDLSKMDAELGAKLDASVGAQITDAVNAAIVDLRNANFQNAQHVHITGMTIGTSSGQPASPPPGEPGGSKPTGAPGAKP